ncbi:MAG: hydrogenase iron-sulfur subunit, partial [Anaerolineae bacterium]|nr:hydrogenase iron-sulfur subunit [Anaerolineae bacterium]
MGASQTKPDWEPRIVTFLCNWCLYSRLDQADIARVQEQPNVRIVKIPCLGRMDPLHVLVALQEGVDGVLVAGCHPGDCHYKRGNFMAENKMVVLQKVLEAAG